MHRTLASFILLWPAALLAQTVGPPVSGSITVINDGPGDQTDPHLSFEHVAYTSEVEGTSEIRFRSFETSEDAAIPNGGAFDFLSDISGSTIIFTRVTTSSAIFAFDLATRAAPVELDPQGDSNRRAAAVGGQTVAWQDFAAPGATEPEIVAHRLDTGVSTRLTHDALIDKTPAVSPDGTHIVWSKCQPDNRGCDLWEARASGAGWTVSPLTETPDAEETQPDTNGTTVVYALSRTVDGVAERDVAWRPAGGGAEQRLALDGVDVNPNVSGTLVAFERRAPDAVAGNFDIALYDLATSTLYNLTRSAENETLNDITVGPDGTARVAWTVPSATDFNVKAMTFRLGAACTPDVATPAEVCASPGDRSVLADLRVSRGAGRPPLGVKGFTAKGAAVLCVQNGSGGTPATAGVVNLNGRYLVGPADFRKGVTTIARDVTVRGRNHLWALLAGNVGSAFRVQVLARSTCDAAPIDDGVAMPPTETDEGPGHGGHHGCGTTGAGGALAGLIAVLGWLIFGPRPAPVPVPVPVRSPRRPRRR